MLVVSRKQGSRMTIGTDVVVTVLSVKGGTVKLGIEAPRSVSVLRDEAKRRKEAA